MSRTNHHRDQKRQRRGVDLWSRRLSGAPRYCAYSKRLTIIKERAEQARLIHAVTKQAFGVEK